MATTELSPFQPNPQQQNILSGLLSGTMGGALGGGLLGSNSLSQRQGVNWDRFGQYIATNKARIPEVKVSFYDRLRNEIDEWLKL